MVTCCKPGKAMTEKHKAVMLMHMLNDRRMEELHAAVGVAECASRCEQCASAICRQCVVCARVHILHIE